MFEQIQIELTRVRRMVELVDDPFLLYLVDILIVEVKARADKLSLQALDPPPSQPVGPAFAY